MREMMGLVTAKLLGWNQINFKIKKFIFEKFSKKTVFYIKLVVMADWKIRVKIY